MRAKSLIVDLTCDSGVPSQRLLIESGFARLDDALELAAEIASKGE